MCIVFVGLEVWLSLLIECCVIEVGMLLCELIVMVCDLFVDYDLLYCVGCVFVLIFDEIEIVLLLLLYVLMLCYFVFVVLCMWFINDLLLVVML